MIHHHNQGVLVDPAWDFEYINDAITGQKIEIIGVLLTHSHSDHTNLAEKFARLYNCPIYMSAIEIDYYGFESAYLKPIYHLDPIELGLFAILPILTPGHTKGSVCYLIDNELFTGDTFFIEGVGICEGKEKNAADLYDSVQLIKDRVLLNTKFWPGHSFGEKPGKDLAHLLKNNIYFQFEHKQDFVKFRMRKNRPNPFLFK